MPKTTNKPAKKLVSIDILKGVAILVIILAHSTQLLPVSDKIRIITQYGQMGCQLFFLVSGFTLCLSWFNNKKQNIADFYKKRFFNIAPGYYLTIITFFIISYAFINTFGFTPIFMPSNSAFCVATTVAFLNGLVTACNNVVVPGSWYIGTIMILYLIFPFVVATFNKIYLKNKIIVHSLPYAAVAVSVCLQLALAIRHHSFAPSTFFYFSFINQLSCFMLGMSLYFTYKKEEILNIRPVESISKFIIFTIIAFRFLNSNIPLISSVTPMVSALAFYWLFIFLHNSIDSQDSITNKAIVLLIKWGKVSYAAFLIHTIFVWYFQQEIIRLVRQSFITYDPRLLYIIIIVPIYILVYFAAKYFNKIIAIVSSYRLQIVKIVNQR